MLNHIPNYRRSSNQITREAASERLGIPQNLFVPPHRPVHPVGDVTTKELTIATTVLRNTGRDKPADGALRDELRRQRGLPPQSSTAVAQGIFAYHRWLGWIDKTAPLTVSIVRALEMQGTFNRNPAHFTDADLRAHAIPAWAQDAMEVTADWCRALQAEPRLWLRARKGRGDALAQQLWDSRVAFPADAPEAIEFRGKEDLFRSELFHAGEFEVQDLNSQMVGLLCAPQPGETWWDACAGEGGKLLHLSDLMQNKGLLWASDRAEWRLKRLKLRAGRAKAFNYRSVLWDGGAKLPTKTKFDGVLVDAPCSGVGTWQRNPHSRWTTTPDDVRELGAVQLKLLRHVAPSVKPGGRLIYSVCTLTRAETTAVTEAFAKDFPSFQPLPLPNPFDPSQEYSPEIRLRPEATGGNGMFIAAWRRTS